MYDSGTRAIYGDYLLMRTDAVLAAEIELPAQIPDLVQKVYDEENDLELSGSEYAEAVDAYKKDLQIKQQHVGNYLMMEPKPKKDIGDLLYNPEKSDEKLSEACVRDGESSVEVLLMKKGADGKIFFVDDDLSATQGIAPDDIPSAAQGHNIARQRIRLPHIFSTLWNIEQTIKELEEVNSRELVQWQQSPWIRGELVLLLDEDNRTELNGYRLSYSYDRGLEYEKKEEENAGERI